MHKLTDAADTTSAHDSLVTRVNRFIDDICDSVKFVFWTLVVLHIVSEIVLIFEGVL